MKMISSKDLEKENWISFELCKNEEMLTQEDIDELALYTYKWALKLNVQKLKNNKIFMKRVKDANERKGK